MLDSSWLDKAPRVSATDAEILIAKWDYDLVTWKFKKVPKQPRKKAAVKPKQEYKPTRIRRSPEQAREMAREHARRYYQMHKDDPEYKARMKMNAKLSKQRKAIMQEVMNGDKG